MASTVRRDQASPAPVGERENGDAEEEDDISPLMRRGRRATRLAHHSVQISVPSVVPVGVSCCKICGRPANAAQGQLLVGCGGCSAGAEALAHIDCLVAAHLHPEAARTVGDLAQCAQCGELMAAPVQIALSRSRLKLAKAVAMMRRGGPQADPTVMQATSHLASTLLRSLAGNGRRRTADADQLLPEEEEDLQEDVEATALDDSSDVLREASSMAAQALKVQRRVMGSTDPRTQRTVATLARCHWLAGRLSQARPLLSETLATQRSTLGSSVRERPPRSAGKRALAQLTKCRAAMPCSPQHPQTVETVQRLGLVHTCLGRGHLQAAAGGRATAAAREHFEQAVPLLRETLASQRRWAAVVPSAACVDVTGCWLADLWRVS
jgi:hypothetical protein